MQVQEGLAIASYCWNVSDDDWIGRRTDVDVMVYDDFRDVTLTFWIPPDAEPRTVVCTAKDQTFAGELTPGEPTAISIPCEGMNSVLSVIVHIPEAPPAPPPDKRMLGALLVEVRAT